MLAQCRGVGFLCGARSCCNSHDDPFSSFRDVGWRANHRENEDRDSLPSVRYLVRV